MDSSSAPSHAPTSAIVIGAGVIGLTTAWQLHERGIATEIWTRDDPWQTTSAVAGAIWYPFLAEPRERVLAWSATTFRRLMQLARQSGTGVAMQSVVEVFDHAHPDLWWASAVPDLEHLHGADVPPGFVAAIRAKVPVCDVPIYLQWLLDGLQRRGVTIVRRKLSSLQVALDEAELVVHCAGLGARELCGDREVQAVRGQVLRMACEVPHAWIDDTGERPCYVIPRADGLVVGGTAQSGDERLEVDAGDTATILAGVGSAFPQLLGAGVHAARVGLRPYRATVRVEREDLGDGRVLVHNYGHGGAGYTLAWGCAEEAVSLAVG